MQYGRRLLHQIVDEVADDDPERLFVFVSRYDEPEDGWKPVTYGEVAGSIAHVAYEITNEMGFLETGSFLSWRTLDPTTSGT